MKQKISRLKRGAPSANIGLEKIRTYAFNKRPVDYEEEPEPKSLLHEYTSMNFKVAKNAHEPTFRVCL